MRLINYVGTANERRVTQATIVAAGLPDPGADLVWNNTNGFELNVADPVAAFLLAADQDFQDDGGLDFGDLYGLTAANMGVTPVGEMIAANVQAALEDLYLRTGGSAVLETARKRLVLKEDFTDARNGTLVNGFTPPAIAVGDRIGETGWWVPSTAPVAPTIANNGDRASMLLSGVTTVNHWTGAGRGNFLRGSPEFRFDAGIRIVFLNGGGDEFCSWVGLHDGLGGTEPSTGIYLEYNPANAVPGNWYIVFANAGARTKVNTGVAVETVNVHAWSVRCDGGNPDRTYRVYYDGALVNTTVAPVNRPVDASTRFGPCVMSRKTLGSGVIRSTHLDYFDLDWKRAA